MGLGRWRAAFAALTLGLAAPALADDVKLALVAEGRGLAEIRFRALPDAAAVQSALVSGEADVAVVADDPGRGEGRMLALDTPCRSSGWGIRCGRSAFATCAPSGQARCRTGPTSAGRMRRSRCMRCHKPRASAG
jgi:hypothetical protein